MKNIDKRPKPSVKVNACLLILSVFSLFGCNKFLDIPLPTDQLTADGAYITDNTTSAVVTGIFFNMYGTTVFSGGESIGNRAGLYTDELTSVFTGTGNNQAFYNNSIQSANVTQWGSLYRLVYQTNLAIEGITQTKSTLNNKNQWLGEALFSRAYLYYYLVNLFGDVPLLLASDVVQNNRASRTPKEEVYNQIIADLKEAQNLLSNEYKDGFSVVSAIRARPNKAAAAAMLARVYLERSEWANAEAMADQVISNGGVYQLVAPDQTFLAGSKETIWALAPTGAGFVREWTVYNNNMPAVLAGNVVPTTYVSSVMSNSLVELFDKDSDLRYSNWIRLVTKTTPAAAYYMPNKYKSNVNGPEFVVNMRLAEQYLIRAEARVRQGKLAGTDGGKADLDAVRMRAGLLPSEEITEDGLIDAILLERRRELFTEFGFRFFDLKRTGTINTVMNIAAPLKGGVWNSQKQIWPIAAEDILINQNLTQAPGYN